MSSSDSESPISAGEASTLLPDSVSPDAHVDSRESWLAELAQTPSFVVGPREGDVVGDEYVVERALGEGAMGVVYLANHPTLQRKVALKIHRARSSRSADRLLEEARAAAAIQHENVLVVHGVGTWQGQVFVAMEFVDGMTARQWVKAEPRTWREVVALYLEAGRGLAAAHARGLVHRDFKPDNVLVQRATTGRGRVKVADFGLAGRVSETSATHSDTAAGAESKQSRSIVGSPAYMAPEQYQSADVDARADQFSFCVALFEALFGRRPFEGDDLPALAAAIASGRFQEPEGADVPAHVRRVVRRGLSRDRDDRFPDMPTLLHALGRDPATTRRRIAGGVAAMAIGATVTWVATRRPDPLPACLATPAIASWWDEAASQRLRTAMRPSGRDHVERTMDRVDAVLVRYRDDASNVLASACEATHVTGTRARVELEAQAQCLTQRGREVTALVEVLSRGTPEIVDRAISAVEALSPVDRCSDPDALDQTDDQDDPRLVALKQQLARVRSLRLTGGFDEAAALAATTLDEVRTLARPHLHAELALELAVIEAGLRRTASASATLREAVNAAILAGSDPLAADIAAQGVFVDGYLGASYAQAQQWSSLGWAWLDRAGRPMDLVVQLLGQRGVASRTADRLPEAVLDLSLALALLPPDDQGSSRAGLLAMLAETYRRMGRRDLARSNAAQALAVYTATLGERHPYTLNAQNLLVTFDLEAGRYAEVEATLRHLVTVGEEVLGPDSPRLADPRVNLATVLSNTGRADEALAVMQRVYDSVSRPDSPRDETRVQIIGNFAISLANSGQLARAREIQAEATLLAREVGGPQSSLYATQASTESMMNLDIDPKLALARSEAALAVHDRVAPDGALRAQAALAVGAALARLDRCADAEAPLTSGYDKLSGIVGEEHPALSGTYAAMGHCKSLAGQHDEAIALLDRATRLNAKVTAPSPIIVEWLALAHLAKGDRSKARELHAELVSLLRPEHADLRRRAEDIAASLDG
jgi:tetratricopeptide (TPR) repeat protein